MQASLACSRIARVALLAALTVLAVLAVHQLRAAGKRPSSDRPSESTSPRSLQDEVCQTKACRRVAWKLARSMNLSADPCDDFYQFSCGRYIGDNFWLDEVEVSEWTRLNSLIQEQTRNLLEKPHDQGEPTAFSKAKTVYQSCMNTTRLEELGVESARQVLASLGIESWPILKGDAWDESAFDWQTMSLKMMDLGVDFAGQPLFEYNIGIDLSNTSRTTLTLAAPDFTPDFVGLDKSTQKTLLSDLQTKLKDAANLLTGAATRARTKALLFEETRKIAALHLALNMCTKSREDRGNPTLLLQKMTLSQLQQEYPYVSWLNYTKHILPAGANATEDERVQVEDIKYMASLGNILQVTPKRVLANYMAGGVLLALLEVLNVPDRDLEEELSSERWKECVDLVKGVPLDDFWSLRFVTSAMYARGHLWEDKRNKTVEMVQGIAEEMHRLLDSVDWMDPNTRRAALMKADALHFNIAFPPELLNDTLLDLFYHKLEVRPNQPLHNQMAIKKWARDRNREGYRTDIDRHHWTSINGVADMVNAFYSPNDNSLSIPAAVMQVPFFRSDRPQYMNYGGIGFIVGHEMSHAFDTTGVLFDMNGQMANWWDTETKKRFLQKVRCIVDQYDRMRDPDVNFTVNGVLTQDENIADNMGLKLAYRAYVRYSAQQAPEQSVNITDDESTSSLVLKPHHMFWVSFASSWCSNIYSTLVRKYALETGEHSPAVHRVNGALRNVEAFAADFNCPAGSPMNPVHKCQVW